MKLLKSAHSEGITHWGQLKIYKRWLEVHVAWVLMEYVKLVLGLVKDRLLR